MTGNASHVPLTGQMRGIKQLHAQPRDRVLLNLLEWRRPRLTIEKLSSAKRVSIYRMPHQFLSKIEIEFSTRSDRQRRRLSDILNTSERSSMKNKSEPKRQRHESPGHDANFGRATHTFSSLCLVSICPVAQYIQDGLGHRSAASEKIFVIFSPLPPLGAFTHEAWLSPQYGFLWFRELRIGNRKTAQRESLVCEAARAQAPKFWHSHCLSPNNGSLKLVNDKQGGESHVIDAP